MDVPDHETVESTVDEATSQSNLIEAQALFDQRRAAVKALGLHRHDPAKPIGKNRVISLFGHGLNGMAEQEKSEIKVSEASITASEVCMTVSEFLEEGHPSYNLNAFNHTQQGTLNTITRSELDAIDVTAADPELLASLMAVIPSAKEEGDFHYQNVILLRDKAHGVLQPGELLALHIGEAHDVQNQTPYPRLFLKKIRVLAEMHPQKSNLESSKVPLTKGKYVDGDGVDLDELFSVIADAIDTSDALVGRDDDFEGDYEGAEPLSKFSHRSEDGSIKSVTQEELNNCFVNQVEAKDDLDRILRYGLSNNLPNPELGTAHYDQVIFFKLAYKNEVIALHLGELTLNSGQKKPTLKVSRMLIQGSSKPLIHRPFEGLEEVVDKNQNKK